MKTTVLSALKHVTWQKPNAGRGLLITHCVTALLLASKDLQSRAADAHTEKVEH